MTSGRCRSRFSTSSCAGARPSNRCSRWMPIAWRIRPGQRRRVVVERKLAEARDAVEGSQARFGACPQAKEVQQMLLARRAIDVERLARRPAGRMPHQPSHVGAVDQRLGHRAAAQIVLADRRQGFDVLRRRRRRPARASTIANARGRPQHACGSAPAARRSLRSWNCRKVSGSACACRHRRRSVSACSKPRTLRLRNLGVNEGCPGAIAISGLPVSLEDGGDYCSVPYKLDSPQATLITLVVIDPCNLTQSKSCRP